jgi:hypothetical protein
MRAEQSLVETRTTMVAVIDPRIAGRAVFLDPSLPRAREPVILAQTSPVPRELSQEHHALERHQQ